MYFNKKIARLILLIIIVLGFILRFYRLGVIPPALEWDEVAIGYDAYSILKSGRDQFNQLLPLTFRSLDDYKPPLYEYLAVPVIAVFGLNEFAVRFVTAMFGSLSIILTYLLVKQVLKNKILNSQNSSSEIIALLSSFLLAVSPWHLQFSRAAFEVNLSILIVLGAILFFLKGLGNSKYLLISAVFWGLALFSYHSTRVLTPILLLSAIILNYKNIKISIKTISSLCVYSLFFILFLPIFFSKEAQIRFTVTNITNIFKDEEMQKELTTAKNADNIGNSNLYRLFHGNKPILIRQLVNNYIVHYSPQFLFIKGDVPLHHAPGFGLLYITELPFILIGIFLFLKKYLTKENAIIFIWFLIAPLPAAVTLQVPHAVRTELFLPTFQIFSAIGIYSFFNYLKKFKAVYFSLLIIFIMIFYADFCRYLHQYYIHLPFEVGKNWLYGRKETAQFIDSIKQKYERIFVSVKLEHPHIFFLFYLSYDPKTYLNQGGTFSGGWAVDRNRFDKYEFVYITYEELKEKYPGDLLIGLANEFPEGADILKTIYYPNGAEAIKIVEL